MTRQAIAADFGLPEPGPTGPKYPNVRVQLTGEDGNAFAIIAAVRKGLRGAGVSREEQDAFQAEAFSGDYDALLRTAMRWVDVL